MEAEKPRASDKVEYPELRVEAKKEVELPVSIKSIEEEELQLSELNEIEKAQLQEVVSHLRLLLEAIDTPIHIDPSAFSEIVLTPAGEVSLTNNGNSIVSMPMEKLPGSALISVLIQVLPEIKRIMVEKKLATADRAQILERSAKEFRKVTAALPGKAQGQS